MRHQRLWGAAAWVVASFLLGIVQPAWGLGLFLSGFVVMASIVLEHRARMAMLRTMKPNITEFMHKSDDIKNLFATVKGLVEAGNGLEFRELEDKCMYVREALFNRHCAHYGPVAYSKIPQQLRRILLPWCLDLSEYQGAKGEHFRGYVADLSRSGIFMYSPVMFKETSIMSGRQTMQEAAMYGFKRYYRHEMVPTGEQVEQWIVLFYTVRAVADVEEFKRKQNQAQAVLGEPVLFLTHADSEAIPPGYVGMISANSRWAKDLKAYDRHEVGTGKPQPSLSRRGIRGEEETGEEVSSYQHAGEYVGDRLRLYSADKGGHLDDGMLYMGDTFRGEWGEYWLPIAKMPHHLVAGISGQGKSVLLNMVMQGVVYNERYFEKVWLVDLKGGVELWEYNGLSGGKFETVYEYGGLEKLVADLCDTMDQRLEAMRLEGQKNWKGGKILLVIDEFAQIELAAPKTKEGKAQREAIQAYLNRISMLGRAAGVLLWVQLQKATTDVIDSSFRNNLQNSVCFRVRDKLTAANMFGSADDLEVDPTKMKKGAFIYYDEVEGGIVYLRSRRREGDD